MAGSSRITLIVRRNIGPCTLIMTGGYQSLDQSRFSDHLK